MDDVYPLGEFLGGAETSAVFLTTHESRNAAIKLLAIDAQQADSQLSRWRAAANLSHPHLMRIFSTGRSEQDGIALLYIVTEFAEENLSQVLTDRALAADETRAMLEPTLGALEYIHRQGFAHAHLKPSNIMAVGDDVKISSDGICRIGSNDASAPGPYDPPERASGFTPAGDVWSLGVTLVEVLTQRVPVGGVAPPDLPEPFAEIAHHSLERNARDRWNFSQISSSLKPPAVVVRKRRYVPPVGVLILLALLIVVVLGVIIRQSETGPGTPTPATTTMAVPTEAAKAPEPPPQPEPAPKKSAKREAKKTVATPPPVQAPRATNTEPAATAPSEAGDQPMPEILPKARSTIHGKAKVTVIVDVDSSGAVTDARLESPGGSKYFSERTLQAVRRWKFQPVKVDGRDTAQKWRLQFEFQRAATKVQPRRISP